MNRILDPSFYVYEPNLHEHQERLYQAARAAVQRCELPKRVIVQADTGAGKSVVASKMLCQCHQLGRRGLFIARGRKLVDQFSQHLASANLPHGVLMAGRGILDLPIQVASKDTLMARYWKGDAEGWQGLPRFDLVVIDECHESTSGGWLRLVNAFSGSVVVGLTATPVDSEGKGLGKIYGEMVCGQPTSWLINNNYLVPTKVFAPYVPNLKGVGKSGVDWNANDLSAKLNRPSLIGDVVKHWKRLAEGRPTVAFGCTIEHATAMRDAFNEAGIRFRKVDQSTSDAEREEIFGQVADGKIQGFANVLVATQGVDIPELSCAILARPTEVFRLYRQIIGRIRRRHPTKTDAVLLDHAGACYRHGMPDEDVQWTLDDNGKGHKPAPSANPKEREEAEPLTCKKCHALYRPAKMCPNCGELSSKPKTRKVRQAGGMLVEAGEGTLDTTYEQRSRFWHKCLAVMAHRGAPVKAAVAMWKSKYQDGWPEPSFGNVPPNEDWGRKVSELFPQYLRGRSA